MKLNLQTLFFILLLGAFQINAQVTTVGLIGSATPGGWDNDTDMVRDAADTNLWTLTIKLVTGEAKFRANDAWLINWGAATFPKGVGVQDGANIKVNAGDYVVTFNSSTGDFYFDVDSDIGIIGSATEGGWDNDTDMYKDPDNADKYYIKLPLKVGDAKFRANDAWAVNWGANTFPNGKGIQDGPNIPIPTAAEYTVKFDKSTGDYSFELPPAFTSIGIIGDATGSWDNDTDMVQDAGNKNIWRGDLNLIAGSVKFRADDKWDLNWGGTDFPTGKASVGGGNIAVSEPGRYAFWFNTNTLDYNFIKVDIATVGIIGSATPTGWDSDTDMIQDTTNANLWRININLKAADVKFRINDAWAINWGNNTFPVGKGTQDGPNIPVLFGNYNVTFNSLTGDYRFDVVSDIGIIGSATAGGWDNDTDLYQVETDSNLYFNTLDLKGGEAKFRANNGWTVNWGANTFPTGAGTQDGPNIPIAQGGKYYITFNKLTGEYSFTENVPFKTIGIIGPAASGNWDSDVDLKRDAVNGDLWTSRLELAVGEMKFRADDAWDFNWGGDGLEGTAVRNGNNIKIDEAGNYQISLNTKTLAYKIAIIRPYGSVGIIGSSTPGGWDSDTDMTKDANDPLVWKLRIKLVDGELKFRADNDWIVNWGSGDFPVGVGTQDGANIPIPAGDYKITFNTLTGEYNFEAVKEFSKISLVGKSGPFGDWPGDDDSRDTYLDKDPSDINHWTLSSVTLTDGVDVASEGVKFRAEAAWSVNWGPAEAGWPNGTGVQNGKNILTKAGTYKVEFRSDSGEYAFGEPNATINYLSEDVISVYPNPTANFIYIDVKNEKLKGETMISLYDRSGKLVRSVNENSNQVIKIDATSLQTGSYFIKITNGSYLVARNVTILK